MTSTAEQRTWARIAGITFLMNYVLQIAGDYVTIIARGDKTFADTALYVTQHLTLWRCSLLNVGLAWIDIGILAFALYAVLEPVNRRLAQLAFVLRLGASFVGAASLMFRVAQVRIYSATVTDTFFMADQLRTLRAMTQSGANAGIWIAWLFMDAGSLLFFVLFLRSRYVPRWLAGFGIAASALMIPVVAAMFMFPERSNPMKVFGIPGLLAEVATALWLLIRGLQPRVMTRAPA